MYENYVISELKKNRNTKTNNTPMLAQLLEQKKIVQFHEFFCKKNCLSFFIAQLLLEERWAHCGNGSMLPETDSCLNQRLENEIIEMI